MLVQEVGDAALALADHERICYFGPESSLQYLLRRRLQVSRRGLKMPELSRHRGPSMPSPSHSQTLANSECTKGYEREYCIINGNITHHLNIFMRVQLL